MAFGKQRRSSQTYDNDNRGILFENDRKESPKHPDFKGSITVEGKEFWLAGWEKDTKKGPALSLSIEPKQEARRNGYERDREKSRPDEAQRESRDLQQGSIPGWDDDDPRDYGDDRR